jgi:hypothetical protein
VNIINLYIIAILYTIHNVNYIINVHTSGCGVSTHTHAHILPQTIVYVSSLQPEQTLCELKSSKCKQTRVGCKKKRHACHSFNWGCVFFVSFLRFFRKKKWYTFVFMCVTRVLINESPYFLHPQSATAVTIVITTTAHHKGDWTFAPMWFFGYCFNEFIIYGNLWKNPILKNYKH